MTAAMEYAFTKPFLKNGFARRPTAHAQLILLVSNLQSEVSGRY